jgi:hypothetical protein
MSPVTIEALADEIRAVPEDSATFDIWVADEATFGGVPLPSSPTGIAAAILTDAALFVGLWPAGSSAAEGGVEYHFRRRS